MRALVFDGPGRVALRPVAEPTISAATDALVDVDVAGVCGTDTHAVHDAPSGLAAGTVLGHEFVGRVRDVGTAVTTIRPGDVVVGSDFTACGRCWWCRRRDHWHCPQRRFFGTGTAYGPAQPGGLAEVVAVPFADTTLARLSSTVPAPHAVLATDTLATALTACDRADVRPGDVVAVIGGGPVGQLATMIAQASGASAVVVADPVEERRQVAAQLGAVATIPAEVARCGLELTDGRGYDAVLEAVGSLAALEQAVEVVRGCGTVVAVGVPAARTWDLPVREAFRREVTLRFAVGDPIRERDRALTMLATRQIDVTPVIGTEVLLGDVVEWFHAFGRGEVMKVIVHVGASRG